jgi:hypothetical protein
VVGLPTIVVVRMDKMVFVTPSFSVSVVIFFCGAERLDEDPIKPPTIPVEIIARTTTTIRTVLAR